MDVTIIFLKMKILCLTSNFDVDHDLMNAFSYTIRKCFLWYVSM